jgi:hypothetical protein
VETLGTDPILSEKVAYNAIAKGLILMNDKLGLSGIKRQQVDSAGAGGASGERGGGLRVVLVEAASAAAVAAEGPLD